MQKLGILSLMLPTRSTADGADSTGEASPPPVIAELADVGLLPRPSDVAVGRDGGQGGQYLGRLDPEIFNHESIEYTAPRSHDGLRVTLGRYHDTLPVRRTRRDP